MTKKRIALIGAGTMGANHARVIAQSSRAELSLVVDPSQNSGRAIADRFDARWEPEVQDLTGIDAVIVAAPTELHHKIALRVLSQDLPLLLEKPVADDLEHTRDIVDLAGSRDLPLMCGLLERYNPAVMTAHSLISEPIHVDATRHSPFSPRIRTGVAWDLLIHDVDLILNIFGSTPTRIESQLGQFHPDSGSRSEDVAEALLGFGSGALAHASASRMGQRKIRSVSIHERSRLIEVDLLRRDVTIYHHVSEAAVNEGRGYRQQTIIEIPELITSQEPLTTQFNRFLDVVDGDIDAEVERATILPAHVVIDSVLRGEKTR